MKHADVDENCLFVPFASQCSLTSELSVVLVDHSDRGVNALGVETDGVMVGAVDLSATCSGSPVCRNGTVFLVRLMIVPTLQNVDSHDLGAGGFYKRNCSTCNCPTGWNGSTCQDCAKNCSAASPGTTGYLNSTTCQCACRDG